MKKIVLKLYIVRVLQVDQIRKACKTKITHVLKRTAQLVHGRSNTKMIPAKDGGGKRETRRHGQKARKKGENRTQGG